MRLIVWLLVCLTLFVAVFKGNQFGAFAVDVDDDDATATDEEPIPGSTGSPNAEETEEDYEEEEIALVASPDAHTRVLIPDFPTKKIPVGKEVTVLVGFSNSGSSAFTLTSIGAHLHSPYDFSYHIQNFTEREIDGVVEPGAQLSLEYTFKPDPSLEPLEFLLSGFVTYNNSENVMFRSTFVNGTIELTEAQSDFDVRGLFTWFLGLGALGLIAYVGFNTFATPEQKKIVKRVSGGVNATPTTPKKLASEDSGFLDSLYTPSKTSSAVGSRKPKKPRSKKDDS